MKERPPVQPNTPEYVELVSSNVHDEGDTLQFDFTFAHSMKDQEILDFLNDQNRSGAEVVIQKLYEKGWVTKDGRKRVEFDAALTPAFDGKIWQIVYTLHKEEE